MEKEPKHRPFDAAMVAKVLEEVEEKALGQRSAAVDAAMARRVDRPGARAEDIDREAARALRGGLSRKKIRKKTQPLVQRAWVKAAGFGVGLAALFGVVYFMTRPPSEERLYQNAKMAVESHDEQRVIDDTQRFLEVYPAAVDPRAQDIRRWRQQFWVAKREKQLFNRFERKLAPEDDGQRLSARAMLYENDGDTENAERLWREMEDQYKDTVEPEPAVYGWVAKKKRADLTQIDQRVEKLSEILAEQRAGRDRDRKAESEAEHLSLLALRFDQFGDLPAARDEWAKIREQFLKPLDVRPWGILAAYRANQLKTLAVGGVEKERSFRLDLLNRRLASFDQVTMNSDPTEKRKAAAIYRDLIDLYGRNPDPEINQVAHHAEQKLRNLGLP